MATVGVLPMGAPVTFSDFDSRLPQGKGTAYNTATVAYPPFMAFTGLYRVGLV